MSKKPTEPESSFRPDPNRKHPPIDENVHLPHQVRRAAAAADALSTGQPVAAVSPPKWTRSESKIALTDADIDGALQFLDSGGLEVTEARIATIIELAREGARLPLERLRGKIGDDGIELIATQAVFDVLEVPQRSRGAGACRRLAKLMRELGWTPIRARGLNQRGLLEQIRGYARDRSSSPLS